MDQLNVEALSNLSQYVQLLNERIEDILLKRLDVGIQVRNYIFSSSFLKCLKHSFSLLEKKYFLSDQKEPSNSSFLTFVPLYFLELDFEFSIKGGRSC